MKIELTPEEKMIIDCVDNGNLKQSDKMLTSKNRRLITILAQAFYGNRTETQIEPEEIDYFLNGISDKECFPKPDIDRQTVSLPGTTNLYLIYDAKASDKYINVDFPKYYAEDADFYREKTGRELKPNILANVPELNLCVYSRCFICRIDDNGELEDLHDEDFTVALQWLSK